MPDYLKRTGRDVTEDTTIRIPEAEKTISRLRGPASKRLSIDRGDIPSVAAPFEGQMMIQYADNAPYVGEQPYYYSNGMWRPFFRGLDHAEGRYQISGGGSVSVASAGAAGINWAHVSGDALLDISSPGSPTPTVDGWHTIDLTYSTTDPSAWTPGAQLRCLLQFFGAQTRHAYDAVVAPEFNLPSSGDQEAARGVISLSGHMRAGTDTFALQLENYDSLTHDLTLDTIEVSRVYST